MLINRVDWRDLRRIHQRAGCGALLPGIMPVCSSDGSLRSEPGYHHRATHLSIAASLYAQLLPRTFNTLPLEARKVTIHP